MLEVRFKRASGIAVLSLSGSVDIDSAILIEKVGWCLENGYRDILCDLEEVELIDYAGLSALAIAYKDVVNHSGRMKFVHVAVHLHKVFSLVCLDRVFEIYDDPKAALRSFQEDKHLSEIQKQKLRRRFKRLPLDIAIEFKALFEEKYHAGKLLNLSGVGMLIFSDKVYPLGEKLDIRLQLKPVPGSLDTQGKVVWLVEKKIQPQIYPAMGVEFYHLDCPTQEKILQFVERNLPLDPASQNE